MTYAFLIAATLLLALVGPASALDLTPAQTEGPYYPRSKPSERDADLTRVGAGPVAKGQVVVLQGKVVDTAGQPIAGSIVEIWQTDAKGIYMHPGDSRTAVRDTAFQFYGETPTGADGTFSFRTILPAPYSGRPRHIHAKIKPPGGATLTTQFYFVDDADIARDGIARSLGKALASVTLAPARPAGAAADAPLQATVTVVVARGKS